MSGYVAFLVARKQSKTQLEIFLNGQTEQRSISKRQAQRDSYSQFIGQVDFAEQFLDEMRRTTRISADDYARRVAGAQGDLQRTFDLLALEGPPQITVVASLVKLHYDAEFDILDSTAKDSGKDKVLWSLGHMAFDGVAKSRLSLKFSFINEAWRFLDDTP